MTVDTRSRSATLTSMRGRSFLKELDVGGDELRSLIDLAAELKADAKSGREKQRLKGKKIALIFEKTSTRTRCAFEVAAYDQGAHVTYLGPDSSQIGQKESIKDTARVLVECSTRSNTVVLARTWSNSSASLPACLCTTGSATSSTRRRCWPTCSRCASTRDRKSTRLNSSH